MESSRPPAMALSVQASPAAEHALVAGRLEPLIHHQDGAPVEAVADAAPKGLRGWGVRRGSVRASRPVRKAGQQTHGRQAPAKRAGGGALGLPMHRRSPGFPPPSRGLIRLHALFLASDGVTTPRTDPASQPTLPHLTAQPPKHTWLSARKACCEYHTSPLTRPSARCPRSLNAFFSWTCGSNGHMRHVHS